MWFDKIIGFYYPYWEKRLTVLAYHSIVSDEVFAASGEKIAVSTSASYFEAQMEFVAKHFSLITMDILQQWLAGLCELPPRPALITFDDGYQDVYTQAMPILDKLNIPATVFLATDYMGSSRMFQWDIAQYCFSSTDLASANLPLLGECAWASIEEREQIAKKWIITSKECSDDDRQLATQDLAKVLQVTLPTENKGRTAFLSWEKIRLLLNKGFSFGSHTCRHPILSKVSLSRVEEELKLSKQIIEQEIDRGVFSFAYPNGLVDDFNADVVRLLDEQAYQAAFTLLPGPVSFKKVRQNPLEIPRVTITAKDNQWRFILKLMGLARFKTILKKA